MDANMSSIVPAGLCSLYKVCNLLYPDQLNPLQVTAVVKFWLGGPDPLDYISMYSHSGNPDDGTPPHWHYISFGLSDLHGDGRVYEPSGPDSASGLGIELTFRLKREPNEQAPPTWPARLLQSLAKYVIQSGNLLVCGDHISYHRALDGGESRLQHILVSSDAALGRVSTPHGPVQFVQVVGITRDELEAVQQWNGEGVIDILQKTKGAGGTLLVTDMRRGQSVFELDPGVREEVDCGVDVQGSNLSGVSAWISWKPGGTIDGAVISDCSVIYNAPAVPTDVASNSPDSSDSVVADQPSEFQAGFKSDVQRGCRSTELGDASWLGASVNSTAVDRLDKYERIHLTLNHEAGLMLPLALRGRLKHGRHFTFKSVSGDSAVTLLTAAVQGSLCTERQPFVARGRWLQVRIAGRLLDRMLADLNVLQTPSASNAEQLPQPHTFSWESDGISVTLTPDPEPR